MATKFPVLSDTDSAGTAGYVLTSNGAGTAPTFQEVVATGGAYLLLDSGAPESGNSYATFAAAVAAADGIDGPVTIDIFDASVAVNAGAFDLTDITFRSPDPGTLFPEVTFGGTATITKLPYALEHVSFYNDKTVGDLCTCTTDWQEMYLRGNLYLENTGTSTTAFFNLAGKGLTLYCGPGVGMQSAGTVSLVTSSVANAQLYLYVEQVTGTLSNELVNDANVIVAVYTPVLRNGNSTDVAVAFPLTSALSINSSPAPLPHLTTGTAPAFEITPLPSVSTEAGTRFQVQFHDSAPGPSTLAFRTTSGSLSTAYDLKKYTSAGAKVIAAVYLDQIADIVHDGTDFVVLNPVPDIRVPTSALAVARNWRTRTPANDGISWYGLGYSPALRRFVACSNSGGLMSSDDGGRTWTTRTAAVASDWRAVAWSPTLNLFVIVGISGTKAMSSVDGITWTSRTLGATTSTAVLWIPQTAQPSRFVATDGGSTNVYVSTDGLTWTAKAAGVVSGNLAYSPELDRIVSVNSTTGTCITSDDGGETWSTRTMPSTNGWIGVAWSPKLRLFVACAYTDAAATGKRFARSSDGITWTDFAPASQASAAFYVVTWLEGLEVFVAPAGSGATAGLPGLVSEDGINWMPIDCSANNDWRTLLWSPEWQTAVATAVSGTVRVMTTQ